MIREMCEFSNMSNSNGAKLQAGFNASTRQASQQPGLMSQKKV